MLELPNYYQELFQRLDPKHPNCLSVDKLEDEGHSIIDNLCDWYKYFYDEITRGLENVSAENFVPSIGMAIKALQVLIPTLYSRTGNIDTISSYDYGTLQPIAFRDANTRVGQYDHYSEPYTRMGYAVHPLGTYTETSYNSQGFTTTCEQTVYETAATISSMGVFTRDAYAATYPQDQVKSFHEYVERFVITEGTVTTEDYTWWAFAIQFLRPASDRYTLDKLIEYGVLTGDGGYATVADMPDAVLANLIDFSVLQDVLDGNNEHIYAAAPGMRQCFHLAKYGYPIEDLLSVQTVYICDKDVTRTDEYDASEFGEDSAQFALSYWEWVSDRYGSLDGYNYFIEDLNGITDLSKEGFLFTTAEQYTPMPASPTANDTVTKTFKFIAIGKNGGKGYIDSLSYADYVEFLMQYRNWDMISHSIFNTYIIIRPIPTTIYTGEEYYVDAAAVPACSNPFNGIDAEAEYMQWTGEEYPPPITPKRHHKFVYYFLNKHQDVITKTSAAAAFAFQTLRTTEEQSDFISDATFRNSVIAVIKTYMASKWPEFNELND